MIGYTIQRRTTRYDGVETWYVYPEVINKDEWYYPSRGDVLEMERLFIQLTGKTVSNIYTMHGQGFFSISFNADKIFNLNYSRQPMFQLNNKPIPYPASKYTKNITLDYIRATMPHLAPLPLGRPYSITNLGV